MTTWKSWRISSSVGSSAIGDRVAKESTLDIGGGGRIGACGSRIYGGITLEVDIEATAPLVLVAGCRTSIGIVGLEC